MNPTTTMLLEIYRYEYDAEGNRTKRVDLRSGESTEYSWNYHNQLTDVVTKNNSGEVTRTVEWSIINQSVSEIDGKPLQQGLYALKVVSIMGLLQQKLSLMLILGRYSSYSQTVVNVRLFD
jgi:hypothetical protein